MYWELWTCDKSVGVCPFDHGLCHWVSIGTARALIGGVQSGEFYEPEGMAAVKGRPPETWLSVQVWVFVNRALQYRICSLRAVRSSTVSTLRSCCVVPVVLLCKCSRVRAGHVFCLAPRSGCAAVRERPNTRVPENGHQHPEYAPTLLHAILNLLSKIPRSTSLAATWEWPAEKTLDTPNAKTCVSFTPVNHEKSRSPNIHYAPLFIVTGALLRALEEPQENVDHTYV